jgi:hypothetical protein
VIGAETRQEYATVSKGMDDHTPTATKIQAWRVKNKKQIKNTHTRQPSKLFFSPSCLPFLVLGQLFLTWQVKIKKLKKIKKHTHTYTHNYPYP